MIAKHYHSNGMALFNARSFAGHICVPYADVTLLGKCQTIVHPKNDAHSWSIVLFCCGLVQAHIFRLHFTGPVTAI